MYSVCGWVYLFIYCLCVCAVCLFVCLCVCKYVGECVVSWGGVCAWLSRCMIVCVYVCVVCGCECLGVRVEVQGRDGDECVSGRGRGGFWY